MTNGHAPSQAIPWAGARVVKASKVLSSGQKLVWLEIHGLDNGPQRAFVTAARLAERLGMGLDNVEKAVACPWTKDPEWYRSRFRRTPETRGPGAGGGLLREVDHELHDGARDSAGVHRSGWPLERGQPPADSH